LTNFQGTASVTVTTVVEGTKGELGKVVVGGEVVVRVTMVVVVVVVMVLLLVLTTGRISPKLR